jgi:hypothetical protein
VRALIAFILVAVAAAFALPRTAAAQSGLAAAKTELTTAIFHSGELAQRGNAVAASKTHLQHTMNCLEGPKGPNFNAAPGNPCQGQGNGVIPDLQAARDAGVAGAGRALTFVNAAHALILTAVKSDDVNMVQPYAAVISNQLKQALAALP